VGDAKNICLKHHTVKSQLKPRFARLQQTITFRLANFFVQKTLWPNWRKVFLIKRDAEKVAFRSPCISIQAIIMVFRNVQLSYDNLPAIFWGKIKIQTRFSIEPWFLKRSRSNFRVRASNNNEDRLPLACSTHDSTKTLNRRTRERNSWGQKALLSAWPLTEVWLY